MRVEISHYDDIPVVAEKRAEIWRVSPRAGGGGRDSMHFSLLPICQLYHSFTLNKTISIACFSTLYGKKLCKIVMCMTMYSGSNKPRAGNI